MEFSRTSIAEVFEQGLREDSRYMALVDIERDIMGVEFAAALYESYAADHEWDQHRTRSLADYASSSARVAEGLEAKFNEEMERKFFAECRNIGWRNPYMEGH